MRAALCLVIFSLVALGATPGATFGTARAVAGEVLVAVAANFAAPARDLAEMFGTRTGHVLRISVGSTGTLHARIVNGAPYDVFLAADQSSPARLEAEGRAVAGSRFTYATGRLALWCPSCAGTGPETLSEGRVGRLAMANPALAPYGAAAAAVLDRLGLSDALADRIVLGENVGQTYAIVATGNAAVGFVALSQLADAPAATVWIVPGELHAPLRQDAVLLAADNAAAAEFLAWLRTGEALGVMAAHGYRDE